MWVDASKPSPLLCELHAHSTWSDGALSRGSSAISTAGGLRRPRGHRSHDAPAREVHAELRRVPGRPARRRAGGAALQPARDSGPRADLRRPRSGTRGARAGDRAALVRRGRRARACLRAARAQGAALVAAHPYRLDELSQSTRRTQRSRPASRLAAPRRPLRAVQPRDAVRAGSPTRRCRAVASGDFHRPEHLATWKTLLPCPKDGPRRRVPPLARGRHSSCASRTSCARPPSGSVRAA